MIKKYLKYLILFILFVIVLVVSFYNTKEDLPEVVLEENVSDTIVEDVKVDKIKVDIKGEVKLPGVYELDGDSRVMDAINISGGLTESADTSLINLSKKLSNEMVIIIYNKNEIAKIKEDARDVKVVYEYIEKECSCPDKINDACVNDYKEPSTDEATDIKDSKININKASISDLQKIPGIGESKAKAIIEYREKTPFEKIEDITNISGIGKSTFEKLKDYITV